MARIGLKALGVNLDPIKHLTIEEVFGSGIVAVTECNKKWWKIIRDKDLKIKLDVKGVK
jgi:hypothetical protein